MTPTIYLVTYYGFNHSGEVKKPISEKFLSSPKRYVYYLIDEEIPAPLQNKEVIIEKKLDPLLYEAGKKYFAEWSLLLAEAKHSFCTYPFFMISSRFYDKNSWLHRDLNSEWDQLFSFFDTYDWGYLPSYDRPLKWIDISWEKRVTNAYKKRHFFPFKDKTFYLMNEVYNMETTWQYPYTSDLLCNYIGFKNRESLLKYVDFYMPLINRFFDANFEPKLPLEDYVIHTGAFRKEKPFTFLLEFFSHFFFFKTRSKFFALHYDGYYEIDESACAMKKLINFEQSVPLKLERLLDLKWRQSKTHPFLKPARKLWSILKTKSLKG